MRSKIAALSLIMIISFVSAAFAVGDNKYYSEFAFKHKLNDKFDVYFTPETRLKSDMGNPYYYQWRVGSTFHANKHLDLALAYRYIQTKDSNNQWDSADTQYVEMIVIPKTKLGNFNLSDANKVERRFIKNDRPRWVYRNQVTTEYPAKIGNFAFAPYISEEAYYDFEIGKFNLNWVTLGANKKISKNLSVGLYYRDETSRKAKTSHWVTNHILGSNVTVSF